MQLQRFIKFLNQKVPDACLSFIRCSHLEISEIFCFHFCTFFTRGRSGKDGHSQKINCSKKKTTQTCHFQCFGFGGQS